MTAKHNPPQSKRQANQTNESLAGVYCFKSANLSVDGLAKKAQALDVGVITTMVIVNDYMQVVWITFEEDLSEEDLLAKERFNRFNENFPNLQEGANSKITKMYRNQNFVQFQFKFSNVSMGGVRFTGRVTKTALVLSAFEIDWDGNLAEKAYEKQIFEKIY
jgi:hypothetical protein